jgi:signal transduction histidine kinase
MEVSDDGRGITKKELLDYKSIGLMGMRERAYSVKGNLTIMGTRGKGTIVTLNVPLNKRKTNANKTIKHGLKKVPEGG